MCEEIEPKIYLKEYDFNRKLARKVKELLEAMGATVYMVCPEVEGDISLSSRAARANNFKTNYKKNGKTGYFVFVSIHGNAFGKATNGIPEPTDGPYGRQRAKITRIFSPPACGKQPMKF